MPQLDVTSFTAQILWLVTIYFTFYILLLKYILPKIGRMLKFRKNYKMIRAMKSSRKESRDLTRVINAQLNDLAEQNLSFFRDSNGSLHVRSSSEENYLYSDSVSEEQLRFLRDNLESLFIKKQLLERYENEKKN